MRQTSLQAYQHVRTAIGGRQQLVLSAILQLGIATDKQVAKSLQWPINCLTPRRLELVKAGLVEEVGVTNIDGRKQIIWKVK